MIKESHAKECACSRCKVPEITAYNLRKAYWGGIHATKMALIAIFGLEFFEPKDEEAYSLGDRIEIEKGGFIIGATGICNQAIIISLLSGFTLDGPFAVIDLNHITEDEIRTQIGGVNFKKYSS